MRLVSPLLTLCCLSLFFPHTFTAAHQNDSSFLQPFVHKRRPNAVKPLFRDFRIQYLVVTGQDKGSQSRASNIWSTWGPSIGRGNNDSLLFVSDRGEPSVVSDINEMPTLRVIEINEDWEPILKYRKSQLKWMRSLVLSDTFSPFDWLVFIDDDTFLIHNAMREMLQRFNPSDSVMLAKKNGKTSVRGGAGIILSKRMVEELTNPNHRFLLIDAFENAVNDPRNNMFYSDVIISKFVNDHNIGRIINLRELKNEGSNVIREWYRKHPEASVSGVITYHHVSDASEYLELYHHYYNRSSAAD